MGVGVEIAGGGDTDGKSCTMGVGVETAGGEDT